MCDHYPAPRGGTEQQSLVRRRAPHVLIALGLIRIYRLTVSSILGRQCRYLPTCSEFTEDAIARHGLWAGGWMGSVRIASCNPWGGSGFDPVPDVLSPGYRWWRPWRGR
jgi:putative membrane protein insertion efficiency factor